MLTTDWDVNALRESVRAAKRFAAAPAWDGYITGAVGMLFSETTSGLDAHAREIASTIFHPTSTASMTSYSSQDGVVNPDLTVKGTYGLRVVDLSVLVSVLFTFCLANIHILCSRTSQAATHKGLPI